MAGKNINNISGRRKAKKKLKKGPIAFLGGIILVVLLVVIGGMMYLAPGEVNLSESVTVVIDEGMGAKAMASRLSDSGVIKNSVSFVRYVQAEGADGELRPGTYVFEGRVDYATVLAELKRGNTSDNTKNVTVPEGKTVPQIAAIWAEAEMCTEQEFLDACASIEVDYDYIPESVSVGEAYDRLEGFLFPETYNVSLAWEAEDLVRLQLKQFDKVWNEERSGLAADLDMTPREIVTVASLIEREARVESERPLIASVIYNRLDIGQKLEIDATIQYILGEQVDRVLYRHLEIDDPYNTYMYPGLPPGPICSPGKSCIDAALSPADTKYFYYRTKNDGSGEHNFARTYAEHLSNG